MTMKHGTFRIERESDVPVFDQVFLTCFCFVFVFFGPAFEVNFMDDVGQTLLNWASAFGTQEMVSCPQKHHLMSPDIFVR